MACRFDQLFLLPQIVSCQHRRGGLSPPVKTMEVGIFRIIDTTYRREVTTILPENSSPMVASYDWRLLDGATGPGGFNVAKSAINSSNGESTYDY